MELAQDRDGTCGYGEELSSSINAGNFLTSCKVYWLASQEELCSMEQVSKLWMNKWMVVFSKDTRIGDVKINTHFKRSQQKITQTLVIS
jgi:hypothetical protein